MLKNLVSRVAGDPNEKQLRRVQPLVDEINRLEAEMKTLSDLRGLSEAFRAEIEAETTELKAVLAAARAEALAEELPDVRRRLDLNVQKLEKELHETEGKLLDRLLPRAFAAVREASVRATGMRHFDVQLLGGVVLHGGKIAEMKTGEGKTLVATLPLYLNGLLGYGAHLITPNDYLSKFGAQSMGPIYHALGMRVGVIQHDSAFLFNPDFKTEDDRFDRLSPCTRREAYLADITYGTNNEFGFDYLRDNMVHDLSQMAQRPLYYAIVDEIDNILIDEARTPLIISGPAEEASDDYLRFAALVRPLRRSTNEDEEDEEPNGDFTIDEKTRNIALTDRGVERVERTLGVDNLYSPEHSHMLSYLENALRAQFTFKRDKDYIVKDGEVIIVDEFTGRLMYGRRYSEGLHQAIEAKEGVAIQRESLTYATITFQNYFRMYHKLSGMTGTAKTEEEEFQKIYNLDVTIIPTNKPMIRDDYMDVIYKNEDAKWRAVVGEIEEMHKQGRPVLVGTVAIETSEKLSTLLKRRGIEHRVLNAKEHEREASIIAQAGRASAVTVATNMAGRGVDILLGGNPEGLARETLRQQGKDLLEITKEEWQAALRQAEAQCADDRRLVLETGGLHILGTERHEARRIDNQLRGRAGRQGDPGSSHFFTSLEDEIIRRFGGDRIKGIMEWAKMDEDVPLEHSLLNKTIEQAQTRVEGYNFDIRKHVLEFDDVVNTQRTLIYGQRRKILTETNLRPIIFSMVEGEIRELVKEYSAPQYEDDWDAQGLLNSARGLIPLPASLSAEEWRGLKAEAITAQLLDYAEKAYDEKTRELGEWALRVERATLLNAVDSHWVRHLTGLDALRMGINLRAIAQQNPLVAYKKEAFDMFEEMSASIRSRVARDIFRVHAQPSSEASMSMPRRNLQTNRTGGVKGTRPMRRATDTIGRNAPCPCGSGKKYKLCHGRPGAGPLPVSGDTGKATSTSRATARRGKSSK